MLKFTFALVFSLTITAYAQTPQELVQDAQQKQRAGDLRVRLQSTGSSSRCIPRRLPSIRISARRSPV